LATPRRCYPLCLTLAQASLLVLLTTTIGSAQSANRWQLTEPVVNRTTEWHLTPEIGSGPFSLSTTLTLAKLDGTAASIRFGQQLNFGFDSRQGSLFVEGSAVGRTRMLEPHGKLITAGKPFQFQAKRDADGLLRLWIEGQEVYATKKLAGPIGQIVVRPWRNSVSIAAAAIEGSLSGIQDGIYLKPFTAPLLIDGSDQPVVHFRITTKEPKTIRNVQLLLEGTTSLEILDRISVSPVDLPESPLAQSQTLRPRTSIDWKQPLEPGSHDFSINCRLKPDANLHDRVAITIASMTFDDGTTQSPIGQGDSPIRQRLAYAIHKKHQFDCHTFRIPGVAITPAGTLLAVYDMRYNSSRDLQEHIDIGLSRSVDGGQTWSTPTPIMDMGQFGGKPERENGCSDPNILVDSNTGEIFVSAVWTFGKPGTHQWSGRGSEPGFEIGTTAQFMVVRSKDDGQSWSEPENWTRKLKQSEWWLFAPAPGNGITLTDGTLVMPTQGRDAQGLPFSNITSSTDHGKTWTVSPAARDNTTECAVAQLSDGQLMLNMRDNRNRNWKGDNNGRAVATTDNLGQSWQIHSSDHLALPEPVCMASLISHRLSDQQQILLFSNPYNKHARRGMTIQLSRDDGETWPGTDQILLDEFGGAYSSLVMVDHETIGILYESSRADLIFQKVKISEFPSAKQSMD
jgi:sialidase-1